jgi:hypothetical protein
MVKMDYGDMPRSADLAAWRTYVLYNSLPPKRPDSPEPAELDSASNAPLQHDLIAEVWGKPMIGDEKPPTRKWQLDVARRSGWEDSDNQDENSGVAAHA